MTNTAQDYDDAVERRNQNTWQAISEAQWPMPLVVLNAIPDQRLWELDEAYATSEPRKAVDPGFYRDELNRRAANRQTATILRLTYATLALAVVTAVVAIVALVLAV